MNTAVNIIFLGTGGGRFATITQKRRTAGIRMLSGNTNLHLDPGPGALVYSIEAGLDPRKLSSVFVSHCHPDHYTDAEVLVEAMTRGMTQKQGLLVAARSVLRGGDGCEPSISKYHQQMAAKTVEAIPGIEVATGKLKVTTTKAQHSDPSAVGFRFKTEEHGDFAYTSDTEYFESIADYYRDVRLLILCVMRPAGKPWKGHMTSIDAVKILEEVKPERAILTHLGLKMIFRGPAKEAEMIKQKTGIPTTAAIDGMQIGFGDTISVRKPGSKEQNGLYRFL